MDLFLGKYGETLPSCYIWRGQYNIACTRGRNPLPVTQVILSWCRNLFFSLWDMLQPLLTLMCLQWVCQREKKRGAGRWIDVKGLVHACSSTPSWAEYRWWKQAHLDMQHCPSRHADQCCLSLRWDAGWAGETLMREGAFYADTPAQFYGWLVDKLKYNHPSTQNITINPIKAHMRLLTC